ncbi:MAG: hypothetical protein DI569_02755 [Sphingopyxis macrogoltabida]|uniref:Uncharacterized protein n=1 Tax=Sphingopyxis macrogoltabida TaxID=33050 RepID=A0A2W5LB93_SPHMC|nr:MAG: hypothetical protein DI569_02755 [Sphingopyxis macrogoltabida]
MEAASRRANREAERKWKAQQQAQIAANAEDAVADWRTHLRDIVSLHVNTIDYVDWHALKRQTAPPSPTRQSKNEGAAQDKLDLFRPRLFDFMSGGSQKRQQKLADAVGNARKLDEQEFLKSVEQHKQAHAEWETDKALATRMLAGDISAQRDVIGEMTSWKDEGLIGTSMSFSISENFLHAVAHVHDDDVVPTFRRKQLQSGRLSETKMPAGERYELYQDYVCSVALKVAGDLFSVLPRNEIFVTCCAKMLDKSIGHLSDVPILSVQIVRETFKTLRLSAIDPSDSMKNFNHIMSFKRTNGFSPIEPLKPIS